MSRILAAIAMGAAAACGSAGTAIAANCATIAVTPGAPAIPTWNPINPTAQEASFSVGVTRASTTSKSVRLIFLDANSSAIPVRIGTTTGPRYQIINIDSGATISFPSSAQVSSQTVPVTSFGNGTNNLVSVNVKVRIPANTAPAEDFSGGANFSETLNFAVECFKNSNGNGPSTGIDNATASGLTLNLAIPKIASIVTAAPATINFGNFTTTTQTAQVSVKSTSTLNVSVATSNTGKLVRSGAVTPVPADSYIPYSMSFNGASMAPNTTLTNQTRAGVLGSSYPLQLVLTDGIPFGKLAGTYSDTITLTISPGQ